MYECIYRFRDVMFSVYLGTVSTVSIIAMLTMGAKWDSGWMDEGGVDGWMGRWVDAEYANLSLIFSAGWVCFRLSGLGAVGGDGDGDWKYRVHVYQGKRHGLMVVWCGGV